MNKIFWCDNMKNFNLDSSLFVSVSGNAKESIYKKTIYEGLVTEREQKTMRRKVRNILLNFCDSFLKYKEEKNTDKIKKLATEFKKFYSEAYLLNDYSLQSIASGNTSQSKKESYSLMLDAFKKLNTASTSKNKNKNKVVIPETEIK